MRLNYTCFLIFLSTTLFAQNNTFQTRSGGDCLTQLYPFCHGVASGDPWATSIILWTRVTPEDEEVNDEITIEWEIATDPEMNNLLQNGSTSTEQSRDFTIKIEVDQLTPNTSYYYRFLKNGSPSMTGRTRTAPEGDVEKLRFAVATCSKYNAGYFSSYSHLANRNDLNAVIHLGDYFYEYAEEVDGPLERADLEPANETITLEDYRCRHGFYKLDPDLLRLHQQHPVIAIWDDHEIANNAWRDGAQNHQDDEGDFWERKEAAWQAYFEWMPLREDPNDDLPNVYRKLSYGNLADLIMLDTRHEARDEQIEDLTNPDILNPDRSILGVEQKEWLLNELENSAAQWKVIGNQVVFSTVNTLDLLDNFDGWDGYPAERETIVNHIDSLEIDDVVFLTGDIHIGIAADVALQPFDEYDPVLGTGYDETNGDGAHAVELVAAALTSNNLDEADVELPVGIDAVPIVALALNPHGKFVDVVNNGYFILDLDSDRAQADWYWIEDKLVPNSEEYQLESWYTLTGENFLREADNAAPTLVDAPDPAPEIVYTNLNGTNEFLSANVMPNPGNIYQEITFYLNEDQQVAIDLTDVSGKRLKNIFNGKRTSGNQLFLVDVSQLAEGIYFYKLDLNGEQFLLKTIINR